MTREEFAAAVDDLYGAVRDSVGFNDYADELLNRLEEMANAWEHKKGESERRKK